MTKPMSSIARKYRRALRNETGAHFTLEELRAFAERGALTADATLLMVETNNILALKKVIERCLVECHTSRRSPGDPA